MRRRNSPFLMSLAFGALVSILFSFAIYSIIGNFGQSWVDDCLRFLWVSGLGALSTAIIIGASVNNVRWWLYPLNFALQIFFTILFIILFFVKFKNAF